MNHGELFAIETTDQDTTRLAHSLASRLNKQCRTLIIDPSFLFDHAVKPLTPKRSMLIQPKSLIHFNKSLGSLKEVISLNKIGAILITPFQPLPKEESPDIITNTLHTLTILVEELSLCAIILKTQDNDPLSVTIGKQVKKKFRM